MGESITTRLAEDVRHGLAAVLALAERNVRAAAGEEIRQALAADEADSDVTSGEAIWEQAGFRRGLAAAIEIATDGAS